MNKLIELGEKLGIKIITGNTYDSFAEKCLIKLNEVVNDAKKWNAIFNSQRIRILGHGGLETDSQHIGMEIWDNDKPKDLNNEYGQEVLDKYVKTIIDRKNTPTNIEKECKNTQ